MLVVVRMNTNQQKKIITKKWQKKCGNKSLKEIDFIDGNEDFTQSICYCRLASETSTIIVAVTIMEITIIWRRLLARLDIAVTINCYRNIQMVHTVTDLAFLVSLE